MTTPDFVAMLRDASLRVTRPRLAVLVCRSCGAIADVGCSDCAAAPAPP